MTPDDFHRRWWPDFRARFPGKARWVAQDGTETLKAWAEVLQSVHLEDALEANRQALEEQLLDDVSWDSIPAIVKRLSANAEVRLRHRLRRDKKGGLNGRRTAVPPQSYAREETRQRTARRSQER